MDNKKRYGLALATIMLIFLLATSATVPADVWKVRSRLSRGLATVLPSGDLLVTDCETHVMAPGGGWGGTTINDGTYTLETDTTNFVEGSASVKAIAEPGIWGAYIGFTWEEGGIRDVSQYNEITFMLYPTYVPTVTESWNPGAITFGLSGYIFDDQGNMQWSGTGQQIINDQLIANQWNNVTIDISRPSPGNPMTAEDFAELKTMIRELTWVYVVKTAPMPLNLNIDNIIMKVGTPAPLTVDVVPPVSTFFEDQQQTLTCSAFGGTLPYTYQWYDGATDIPILGEVTTSGASVPLSMQLSPGTYSFYATVRDGDSTLVQSATATMTVESLTSVPYKTNNYPIDVGFENLEDFELSTVAKGYVIYTDGFSVIHGETNPPNPTAATWWDRGGYNPRVCYLTGTDGWEVEPEYSIVHSGLQSMRVTALHPQDAQLWRELEMGPDINPYTDTEFEYELWAYFPSELKTALEDSPAGWGAYAVFRPIVERLYDGNRRISPQTLNLNVLLGIDRYSVVLNHGTIDNDNDGADDLRGKYDLFSDGSGGGGTITDPGVSQQPENVVLPVWDQWVHFKAWYTRNLTDFQNGQLKIWIDGVLVWNFTGVRTVGLDPNIIGQYPRYNPGGDPGSYGYNTPPFTYGHVTPKFGLYTGVGTNWPAAPPLTIYYDDFYLNVLEPTPAPDPDPTPDPDPDPTPDPGPDPAPSGGGGGGGGGFSGPMQEAEVTLEEARLNGVKVDDARELFKKAIDASRAGDYAGAREYAKAAISSIEETAARQRTSAPFFAPVLEAIRRFVQEIVIRIGGLRRG